MHLQVIPRKRRHLPGPLKTGPARLLEPPLLRRLTVTSQTTGDLAECQGHLPQLRPPPGRTNYELTIGCWLRMMFFYTSGVLSPGMGICYLASRDGLCVSRSWQNQLLIAFHSSPTADVDYDLSNERRAETEAHLAIRLTM